jgi:hypothetical protein
VCLKCKIIFTIDYIENMSIINFNKKLSINFDMNTHYKLLQIMHTIAKHINIHCILDCCCKTRQKSNIKRFFSAYTINKFFYRLITELNNDTIIIKLWKKYNTKNKLIKNIKISINHDENKLITFGRSFQKTLILEEDPSLLILCQFSYNKYIK